MKPKALRFNLLKPNIVTYYEPVIFKVLMAVTIETHDFLRYDAMYTSCLLPTFCCSFWPQDGSSRFL